MKNKLVLFLFLVLLGGVAYWLWARSTPTTLDRPLSDFAVQDTSRVSRIFITDQQGRQVDLQRTRAGWVLNDVFMAKQYQVELLLKTFARVQVKSPVPKSSEATALRLMGAASKKVEIYEGGASPSKIWIVGHATRDNFGTYMLLEKPGEGRSNAPFIMDMPGFNGVLNTRFHTSTDNWRSTELFNFPDLRAVAKVEVVNPAVPTSSYRIDQAADGRVSLFNGKGQLVPFDTVLVKGAMLPLTEVNFEAIERKMSPASRDSLLALAPNYILKLSLRDGAEHTAKIWLMPYTGDEPAFGQPKPLHDAVRMRALVQDTLLVVMQRENLERILQPISGFQ